MSEISVDVLDDGKVVWGLRYGDVIVGKDGKPIPCLLAVDRGFIVDEGNGCVEIVTAPIQTLNRLFLPGTVVKQAAEWLQSRPDSKPAAPARHGEE